jgi:hypothetical protein
MTPARKREAIQRARQTLIAWSLLCAIGSTIGGIVGLWTWENDAQ